MSLPRRTVDHMPKSVPAPAIVSEYAQAALQNALGLVSDADLLIEHECWPRAHSLAVLAMEEGAKVWMCGLRRLVPPAAWAEFPFADLNWDHEFKLGAANAIAHILSWCLQDAGAPDRPAPLLDALNASIREDNQAKLRGLYVGITNGQVTRPSDVSQEDAQAAIARASMLITFAEGFSAWAAEPPAEVLAIRENFWQSMVETFEQGGFDAMAERTSVMFGSLTEDEIARGTAAMRAVLNGSSRALSQPVT